MLPMLPASSQHTLLVPNDLLCFLTLKEYFSGASEASSKWVGTTKNYSTGSKKWVGTRPFSIKIKQKSGWARAHPAHPAPTPLENIYLYKPETPEPYSFFTFQTSQKNFFRLFFTFSGANLSQ